jgi:hypothetical protein
MEEEAYDSDDTMLDTKFKDSSKSKNYKDSLFKPKAKNGKI